MILTFIRCLKILVENLFLITTLDYSVIIDSQFSSNL
jgi:hypothetical protein